MICSTRRLSRASSTVQEEGAGLPPRSSSSSFTPQATRLMLIRSSGPMLLELDDPPTAPQPRVRAGNSQVVAPMPPRAEGVFTSTRLAGTAAANRLATRSSSVWMEKVWPAPSHSRISTHRRSTASSSSST